MLCGGLREEGRKARAGLELRDRERAELRQVKLAASEGTSGVCGTINQRFSTGGRQQHELQDGVVGVERRRLHEEGRCGSNRQRSKLNQQKKDRSCQSEASARAWM
jgi:hypothetical protein